MQTRQEGQVAATATASDRETLQVDGAGGEGRGETAWAADELDAVFDVVEDLLDADLRREAVVGGDEDVAIPADAVGHVLWDVPASTLDGASIAMEEEEDGRVLRAWCVVDVELELEVVEGLEGDGFLDDGHFDGGRGWCGGVVVVLMGLLAVAMLLWWF